MLWDINEVSFCLNSARRENDFYNSSYKNCVGYGRIEIWIYSLFLCFRFITKWLRARISDSFTTTSPLIDESHLDAQEHIDFLSYILTLYDKTWNDVVAIIGDFSAPTSQSLTSNNYHLLGFQATGSISQYETCEHMKTSIFKNTLHYDKTSRFVTEHLIAKTNFEITADTKWYSINFSFQYAQILSRAPWIPTSVEFYLTRKLSALPRRKQLNRRTFWKATSTETCLQSTARWKTPASVVRTLFDAVIDKYPETATRLKSNADIVLNSDFENFIVKVQRDSMRGLSREESLSINCLIQENVPQNWCRGWIIFRPAGAEASEALGNWNW